LDKKDFIDSNSSLLKWNIMVENVFGFPVVLQRSRFKTEKSSWFYADIENDDMVSVLCDGNLEKR
jgi:hypothetical protein